MEGNLQLKQNQDKSAHIPQVVTYHPTMLSFSFTTRRHLPILHASKKLQSAFPLTPQIAFYRLRNLRDFLVRASLIFTPYEPPSNCPCGASRCKSCSTLLDMDKFTSHTTEQHFKVKIKASCKSSNIIYLIVCRRCSQQYVGETSQPLHCRINSHQYNIAHRKIEESPVAKDFNSEAHSQTDMVVMVINQVGTVTHVYTKYKRAGGPGP